MSDVQFDYFVYNTSTEMYHVQYEFDQYGDLRSYYVEDDQGKQAPADVQLEVKTYILKTILGKITFLNAYKHLLKERNKHKRSKPRSLWMKVRPNNEEDV